MIHFGSGECLLDARPNGGTVVFQRSLITAGALYLIVFLLRELVKPKLSWCPTPAAFGTALYETLPWLGAIFGASYAALYARFASQWAYLSAVYNEIKSAEARAPENQTAKRALVSWEAGFIEDAELLHLHMKAPHASIIVNWLKQEDVRQEYIDAVPGGAARLSVVERQAKSGEEREKAKYMQ